MSRTLRVQTLCAVVVAFVVFLAMPTNLTAQVAGANIPGTVTDTTGKVVPNVHVAISNVATGVKREATTNEEGFYSAPNLLPGSYDVKFSAPGFRVEAKSDITLTVGASVTLDQALRVGTVSEIVSVQSEIPAVQTTSSED